MKYLFILALFLLPYSAFATGTITAGVNGNNEDGAVAGDTTGGGFSQQRASRFVMDSDTSITTVQVAFVKHGSPSDNIVAYIEADVAGVPSNIPLFTSSAASASAVGGLPCPATLTTLTFTNVIVVPGVTYWMVYGRTGADDNSNYLAFCTDSNYSAPNSIGYRIANIWATANVTYFYSINTVTPTVTSLLTPILSLVRVFWILRP